jgi:Fe-S oxidoreductase
MIKLRVEEGLNIGFTIQVDTQCHRIPNFIEKAGQAGVRRVFIGLENINPDNLLTAKKNQNKITEYRIMLQKWREHGAITYAGYIIGFPADTKESILRDVEIIKRELPLDILEFFVLTPLPGSEDHKTLWQKGVWMDPDLNKYDLDHRVSHHSRMSDREWDDAYEAAWAQLLHAGAHVHHPAPRRRPSGRPAQDHVLDDPRFKLIIEFEGVHRWRAAAFA